MEVAYSIRNSHHQKLEYVEGAIDNSFWHVDPEELKKLDPEDKRNTIWNENGK
jgi:hypothetical protein